MAIDRNGNCHCSWCGDPLTDERAHLETCSYRCAVLLGADRRMRERAAMLADRERYRPPSIHGRCPVCGQPAKQRCKCTIPTVPDHAGARCTQCRSITDGKHKTCARCRVRKQRSARKALMAKRRKVWRAGIVRWRHTDGRTDKDGERPAHPHSGRAALGSQAAAGERPERHVGQAPLAIRGADGRTGERNRSERKDQQCRP